MKQILVRLTLFFVSFCFGQASIPAALEKLNRKSVPYITVDKLKEKDSYVLFDSREAKEFAVSRISKAVHVGYDKFDPKKVKDFVKDKKDTIVVYCSIGVRSEKVGEKLLKMGYTNVYNLYGGIFEWKNNGQKVFSDQNKETDKIHTFNKEWSAYLKKGKKVYEE